MLTSTQPTLAPYCDATVGSTQTSLHFQTQIVRYPQLETLTCILQDRPNARFMEFISLDGERVRSRIFGAFTLAFTNQQSKLISMDISGSEVEVAQKSSGYLSMTLDLTAPSVGSMNQKGDFRADFCIVLRAYTGSHKTALKPCFSFPATLRGYQSGQYLQGNITGTLPAEIPLLGKRNLNIELACTPVRWSNKYFKSRV